MAWLFLFSIFCVSLSLGQKFPISNEKYAIINAADGGALAPFGDGKICRKLSFVAPGYNVEYPYPAEYQWSTWQDSYSGFWTIFSADHLEGYGLNQITYAEYPPYCYLVYRSLELIPNGNTGSFAIKDHYANLCLTYTPGLGITSWRECGAPGNQDWLFKKV